jgi:energy-converting hydrogenase Eha subunit A
VCQPGRPAGDLTRIANMAGMNRTAALVVASLAVAAVAAPPAMAAPKKKPITKTYDVTAVAPDPTNYAGQGYSVCAQNVPGSFDKTTIQIPAAGSLVVQLSGFQGDWDLLLEDADDSELSTGGSSDLGGAEEASARFKKAQKVSIVACNWAGTPTATVKYTFTYK